MGKYATSCARTSKRATFVHLCARFGAEFFVARATLKALPGLLFAPVTDPVLFSNKFEFEKGSLAPVHIDRFSDFKPRGRGSNFSVNRTRIIPLFFPLIFPPFFPFLSLFLSPLMKQRPSAERTSMEQRNFFKRIFEKKRSCLPRSFEVVLLHFSLLIDRWLFSLLSTIHEKLIEKRKKGEGFLR